MQMNVSVTEHLNQLVQDYVESGRYTSASEVVRDALRKMDIQDKSESRKDVAWTKLNNMLLEAANSGISDRTIDEIGDAVLKSKGLKR